MAGCVHLIIVSFQIPGRVIKRSLIRLGLTKMRFSLAVVVVVMGIGASGLAQMSQQTNNNGVLRVKPSPPEKAPRSIAPKMAKPATSSSANAKDLQTLEHQGGRVAAATSRPSGTTKPAKASALKPVKDKPTPPINFTGTNINKTRPSQGSDPFKGRVRQKSYHQ